MTADLTVKLSRDERSSRLRVAGQGIFGEFCEKLGKVDLRAAAAVPAMLGCLTVLGGAVLEAHGQGELLRSAGVQALNSYLSGLAGRQLEFSQWMQDGLAGQLHAFGGDVQARGLAFAALGAVVGPASVGLARQYSSVKSFLSDGLSRVQRLFGLAEHEVSRSGQAVDPSRTVLESLMTSSLAMAPYLQRAKAERDQADQDLTDAMPAPRP